MYNPSSQLLANTGPGTRKGRRLSASAFHTTPRSRDFATGASSCGNGIRTVTAGLWLEDSCESQGSERMAVASNVSCTREGVPSVSCASAIEGRSRPSLVDMVPLRAQVQSTCACKEMYLWRSRCAHARSRTRSANCGRSHPPGAVSAGESGRLVLSQ